MSDLTEFIRKELLDFRFGEFEDIIEPDMEELKVMKKMINADIKRLEKEETDRITEL